VGPRRALTGSVPVLVGIQVAIPLGALALASWLSLSSTDSSLTPTLITTMAGGVIATTAMGVVLTRRLRPLQAVHSSLKSLAKGEQHIDALKVDPRLEHEAKAWNAHLREFASLRQTALSRRTEDLIAVSRPSAEALEAACDSLWMGIVVYDSNGRVAYCNGAAAKMLRLGANKPVGKPISQIMSQEELEQLLTQVGESTGKKRFVKEVTIPDGEHETTLRFNAIRASNDVVAPSIILIEDLSQRRTSDQAKDTFVTQATHELRTPLTNIRLYVERAIEDGESDPVIRGECLNVINQEARRLERIVTDMLSVAEIETGSLSIDRGEVRLDALLQELRADYDEQARSRNITLAFDLPPKLPVIDGDRDKLTLALHNLIGNALKYTPEGGEVRVIVADDESGLSISIEDNGIGIHADERDRIFDRFYRVSDPRVSRIAGTGLGLALAREVVRLHGGDISVQSEPERGSTFRLTLPPMRRAA
jgi:PAS domain S-box-containing protein